MTPPPVSHTCDELTVIHQLRSICPSGLAPRPRADVRARLREALLAEARSRAVNLTPIREHAEVSRARVPA
jgi:hypothetical protein